MKKNTTLRPNRKRIVLVVSILSLLTAAMMIYLQWSAIYPLASGITSLFPDNGGAVEGHLPNMTEQNIREQMQKEADISKLSFKINSRPVFENGSAMGNLRIENPNHNIYPFVVEIFLNETGENIYNSGGIPPNHHISTGRLLKNLPKGEHNATAYIYAYDPESLEYSGKSAVALTLVVKA